MTRMFFFIAIDKEGSKRDSSLDQQDILYAHPSSNNDFVKNRGALITLWDISQNQDLVPEVRKLRSLVNTGIVRMCVGVSDVEVAVLDDCKRNLLFLFGVAVDQNWNSVSQSGAGKSLLSKIHTILTFTTSSIRRSLQEVVIRSDLDGMIISALYRMCEKQNPHDALWSQVIPCYKQDANVDELDREMISFDAAEFLDEIFRLFPRSECYILGSCLYYNRVLLVNRLHPMLYDAVHKYLLLHKDGFRSEKDSDKNHVLRCYPKNVGLEVQADASYYVLWTKLENLLSCCIVEVLETSDNINAMVFGSILSSMRTLMQSPRVQHLKSLFGKNSTPYLAHPSSGSSVGQERTTFGSLVRTTSAPNVAQKFSLANERTQSSQGPRPASLSQAPGSFSVSTENLTRHPHLESGTHASPKRRSGAIFCVTISAKSQVLVLESSMDDYSRNSFLPPKLFDDFMHHIPLLRNLLSSTASQSEEVTLLLEYPSPSLFKRYWMSGRTLNDPSREIYLCYQEGFETAVALDFLMKM